MQIKSYTLISILLFLTIRIFSQTTDAEIVKYQTNVEFRFGNLVTKTCIEIKINNLKGEKHTEVSIPFSKLNKVSKLEANIRDLSGNIVKKLNQSEVTEHSEFASFSFYEDNMVKEFTLKHNIFPYILSYSFQEQQSQFLNLVSWDPVTDWEIPVNNATLCVEIPSNLKIICRNTLCSALKTDTLVNTLRYCWQTKYIPVSKPEIYTPDLSDNFPNIQIVPQNFIFDKKGSFDSWTTYGNWQYSLIENLSDLPLPEQAKIKEKVAGVTDNLQKIKILYHYLQDETHYVNISIKTGGMKPFPASFVAENKYGDCKALSNYMKAMLNVIDIRSFYTKVFADDNIRTIDKDFPSQQFNHIILNIPLEKDTVWLDCTSDGPFNYLGTFTQNRDVFIVDKDNSHFTRTPALKPQDVTDVRKVTFSEKTTNEALATFENTYRSDDFMSLFYLNKSTTENRKNQVIQDNYIEKGFNPVDYKIIPAPRDTAYIKLRYSATTSKIYNHYGNEEIIRILPFDFPDFRKPSERKYPVQLCFPIAKSDTLEYQIPSSTTLTGKPDNQDLKSEFGKFSIQFERISSGIRVVKSVTLYSGNYSLKQYPEFFEFIKKIKDIERNSVIITNNQ